MLFWYNSVLIKYIKKYSLCTILFEDFKISSFLKYSFVKICRKLLTLPYLSGTLVTRVLVLEALCTLYF